MFISTIERRDSKTPAGDMWHVLNINRRVEAAEAAIQGMTNLIDTINSDIYEMKNNTPSQSSTEVKEINPKTTTIEKAESQVASNIPSILPKSSDGALRRQDSEMKKMKSKLNTYENRFDDLDHKLENMATRDAIKHLCSEDKVLHLIKENLDNFEPTFPMFDETATKEEPILTNTVEEAKQNTSKKDVTLIESLHEKGSKKACVSVPSITLKRGDSKESKTRVAYQEVTTKILFLEQEISKAKDQVSALETKLGEKIEMIDIEGKMDRSEVSALLFLLLCFIISLILINKLYNFFFQIKV